MASVIIVPTAEWNQIACRAWCDIARDGQRWDDGDQSYFRGAKTWLVWVSDEEFRAAIARHANERVGKAVFQARHCAGFSPDAAWLPSDLDYAADYRLTVPNLTGDDAGHLAAELCGPGSTACLSDDYAAALTPRLMRLARRPNQCSAAYIAKLAELLDRERPRASPALTAVNPRDKPRLERLHGMDEVVAWGLDLAQTWERFGAASWTGPVLAKAAS